MGEPTAVPPALPGLGDSPVGPLCIQGVLLTLFISRFEETGHWPRCLPHRLQKMDHQHQFIYFHLQSTHSIQGLPEVEGLPGHSPIDCSIAGPVLVPWASLQVPTPDFSGNTQSVFPFTWPTSKILQSSRVGFLTKFLHEKATLRLPRNILVSHWDSITWQYQSNWKKFQQFLLREKTTEIYAKIVLCLLCFLFHEEGRSLSNTSGHILDLADPFHFGCNLKFGARTSDITKKGYFIRPPSTRSTKPFWYLQNALIQKVLVMFQSEDYVTALSLSNVIHKSLFLIALLDWPR